MIARGLLVAVLALTLAAPADATTLSFADGEYTMTGTDVADILSVQRDESGVTFRDELGSMEAGEGLPADCAKVLAGEIRCTTPGDRVFVHGGDGDDELNGSPGVERMFGDAGDDVFRPGLGRDYVHGDCGDCEKGVDTVDASQDGREKGVRMSLDNGPEDDENFRFGSVENLIGTEFDDDLSANGNEANSVLALGGDDVITSLGANRLGGVSEPDRFDCGDGEDVFQAKLKDEVIDCELFGDITGEPYAGDVRYTQKITVKRKKLVLQGFARCHPGGAPCELELKVSRVGRSTYTLAPGESHKLVVKLTPGRLRRLEREGEKVRRVHVVLKKKGYQDFAFVFGKRVGPP